MSKPHESQKQSKKKPLHTAKEKKALKLLKKQLREHPVLPLLTH